MYKFLLIKEQIFSQGTPFFYVLATFTNCNMVNKNNSARYNFSLNPRYKKTTLNTIILLFSNIANMTTAETKKSIYSSLIATSLLCVATDGLDGGPPGLEEVVVEESAEGHHHGAVQDDHCNLHHRVQHVHVAYAKRSFICTGKPIFTLRHDAAMN